MREEVGDTNKIIHNTCMQQKKDAYVSGVCFFSLCRALALALSHTLFVSDINGCLNASVFALFFYLFIVCIYASNCCLPFVNAMMLLGLCLNWRSKTIEAKQILKLIVGAPCLLVLYSSSERLQSVSLSASASGADVVVVLSLAATDGMASRTCTQKKPTDRPTDRQQCRVKHQTT